MGVGGLSRIGVDEVNAIASLLRRPPAQRRSAERVATVLELAVQAATEPHLTTAALAERAGMSVGAIYQFFPDLDTVRAGSPESIAAELARVVELCLTNVITATLPDRNAPPTTCGRSTE